LIPVVRQPEPADFAVKVRRPGQAFLRINPKPASADFKKNNAEYWVACLPQLRTLYGEVCAYSSIWIPTQGTVDHFFPKTKYSHLAYEWRNYRLALDRINHNKGESLDVLDPFAIQPGWFVLDPATLFVKPEPSQGEQVKARVQKTIDILKLNDDMYVKVRFEIFRSYLDGEVSLPFVVRRYPFVAAEITRQNIKTNSEKQAAVAQQNQVGSKSPPSGA
jgi:hypothetical protein